MVLFMDIERQVAVLRDLFAGDVVVEELPARVSMFGGDELVAVVRAAAALVSAAERVSIVGAGVIAVRSSREAGQDGLAQSLGHRSPVALVQEISGVSFGEAQRQVRLGQAILEADAARADARRDDGAGGAGGGLWSGWFRRGLGLRLERFP